MDSSWHHREDPTVTEWNIGGSVQNYSIYSALPIRLVLSHRYIVFYWWVLYHNTAICVCHPINGHAVSLKENNNNAITTGIHRDGYIRHQILWKMHYGAGTSLLIMIVSRRSYLMLSRWRQNGDRLAGRLATGGDKCRKVASITHLLYVGNGE